MHVVIMGCGRVGSMLAHQLEAMDHTIAVIDQVPASFRRLGDTFAGRRIAGVGFDRDTLIAAGIEHAEAFAAVSNGDNSNIISARVAREQFNVRRVIARIYDAKRAQVYERLGIPTVATVPWTAGRLLQGLLGESATEAWRDPSGAVVLVHVSPHERWAGHKLSAFEAATGSRVALITRFGSGELPLPSTVIQSGDSLHVTALDAQVATVRSVAARPPEGSAA